jgi:tRNA(fMet)-specific endonuclease VapC
MRFMLDTNACIDFARGRSARLLGRMETHLSDGLSMSAITYAELSVGARASIEDDRKRLEQMRGFVPVLPFDNAAGARYGELVRQIGLKRNAFDRLIAAHALSRGLTLVTNNAGDFADIPGLSVENWSE